MPWRKSKHHERPLACTCQGCTCQGSQVSSAKDLQQWSPQGYFRTLDSAMAGIPHALLIPKVPKVEIKSPTFDYRWSRTLHSLGARVFSGSKSRSWAIIVELFFFSRSFPRGYHEDTVLPVISAKPRLHAGQGFGGSSANDVEKNAKPPWHIWHHARYRFIEYIVSDLIIQNSFINKRINESDEYELASRTFSNAPPVSRPEHAAIEDLLKTSIPGVPWKFPFKAPLMYRSRFLRLTFLICVLSVFYHRYVYASFRSVLSSPRCISKSRR